METLGIAVGFEMALSALKDGGRVRRQGMSDETYIQMQEPDQYSKMTDPYFYMSFNCNGQTHISPYTFTSKELLAEDWQIIAKDCKECSDVDCSAHPKGEEEVSIEIHSMKLSSKEAKELKSFLEKLSKE